MSAPPAGDAVMVAALPGGMLFAHGLSCPECQFRYCALWGFAPSGQLPPNGICPECTHRWALPSAMRDALAVAASINRVAVLLDADNFEGVQLPELKAWFEQRGQLLIFRAYGNQKTFAGSVWQDALEVGLDLVTCDVRPQAADMAIAVDLGVLASARQYHELYVVFRRSRPADRRRACGKPLRERQHVYWGLPHPLMHHTVQCQIGTKHARKEELVGSARKVADLSGRGSREVMRCIGPCSIRYLGFMREFTAQRHSFFSCRSTSSLNVPAKVVT